MNLLAEHHEVLPTAPNKMRSECKEENRRIKLLKRELEEMRFIRSGADEALIVVMRLPAGDLFYI